MASKKRVELVVGKKPNVQGPNEALGLVDSFAAQFLSTRAFQNSTSLESVSKSLGTHHTLRLNHPNLT